MSRADDEAKVAAVVSRIFGVQLTACLHLGDWTFRTTFAGRLTPVLFEIALDDVRRLANELMPAKAEPVEDPLWVKILAWLTQYTFELITGINVTSDRELKKALTAFVEEPMTMGELKERVAEIFSPERAEAIAVTEVTRMYTEGNRMLVDEWNRTGIKMEEFWVTRDDELVCELCGPLHMKVIGDGWNRVDGPPRHVNCRCRVRFRIPK